MNNKQFFIYVLVLSFTGYTRPQNDVQLIKLGNFENEGLPFPSFGFGQFVLPKNKIAPLVTVFSETGHHQNQTIIYPQVVYGITNSLSGLVSLPIIINIDNGSRKTQAVGDLQLELEYALYVRTAQSSLNRITFVTDLNLPTGHFSTSLTPSTGFGAVSLFFGVTAAHISIDWYAYLAPGMLVTTPTRNTKAGCTAFYQGGVGRNLGNPGGITLVGMLECNGVYIQKDTICCTSNPNSGGNTIFLGPTLYGAFKNIQILGGVQFPTYQHLNGAQGKQKYRLIFNASATF